MSERRIGPRTCRPAHDGAQGGGAPTQHPFDRVVVDARNCNYSAFSGYHRTPSDYSAVRCLVCGTPWRTKAEYVHELPDGRG